ncbi:hypothetical protein BGX38DRAFT_1085488, partial [Terfezia claveryi]
IQEVDQLQNHGVGAADINKLKAAGYFTIASCLSATRKNLAKIKGFSEQKVEKIKEAAAKCAVWPALNFDIQRHALWGLT